MNRIQAFLVLIVVFYSLFLRTAMVSYFAYNQTYISQTFCINQDKPEMHCNGTCYLSKLLQKTQQQEVPKALQELREPSFLAVAQHTELNVQRFVEQHDLVMGPPKTQTGFRKKLVQPPSC